jgi:hypothetical protein
MAFVPDSKASPRLYERHQRYAHPPRLRYSAQKTAFLAAQHARFTTGSPTTAQIFNALYANTAFAIASEAVTGFALLATDPYPARGS